MSILSAFADALAATPAVGATSSPTSASTQGAASAAVVLMLGLWFVLAVGLAKWLGVVRPHSILGPGRLLPGERGWQFLSVQFAGCLIAVGIVTVLAWALGLRGPEHALAVNALLYLVGFVVLVAMNGLLRPNGLRPLGLGISRLPRGVVTGALALFMTLPVLYVVELLVVAFMEWRKLPQPAPHPVLRDLAHAGDPYMIALLVATAVIGAPLVEELLFRGILQTFLTEVLSLPSGPAAAGAVPPMPVPPGEPLEPPRVQDGRSALPRWAAVAVTAFLFARVHGEPAFVPPLFVLGMALGYVYERTGNMWTNITMHALFNGSQIILFLTVAG